MNGEVRDLYRLTSCKWLDYLDYFKFTEKRQTLSKGDSEQSTFWGNLNGTQEEHLSFP